LVTECFNTVVKTNNNDYIIYGGDNKPDITLIPENLAHNAKLLWIGKATDPEYFAIEMSTGKNAWAIVRLSDGTRLCEL
jgi:hypothetical protein